MDNKSRERLVKLLSLTQSSNDNESLSAIRMCNSTLKKMNLTWDQVLSGATYSEPRRQQSQPRGGTYESQVDDVAKAMEDELRKWWDKQWSSMWEKATEQNSKQASMSDQEIRAETLKSILKCQAAGVMTDKLQSIGKALAASQSWTPSPAELMYVRAQVDIANKKMGYK